MLWGTIASAPAQGVPSAAAEQFDHVIGSRVEAVTIFGGDYGAAGGVYTFRGGDVANLSIGKLGGAGDVAAARPLGETGLKWAPVLIGNVGHITAANTFHDGYLAGNRSEYDVWAAQLGGGARFYLTDHLSLAPGVSAVYGHAENDFTPRNPAGDLVETAGHGTYVDWQLDTWSIVPSFAAKYEWLWGRTTFQLGSRYIFFHTEDFHSSSAVVGVKGNSHLWENKIDADVPLGLKVFGRELHTGGFAARTELFGSAAQGVNADYFYTFNGRFVMDLLGEFWKVRWLGLGASYFVGEHFAGWSAGVDLTFQF